MSKSERKYRKQHKKIQARFSTMIYTLFGAFIIPRGGEVHVASLIKLVRPLGFSANAIRLGLSRMFRKGVFNVRKVGRRSCYSLSTKGTRWMEQGRVRAFDFEHKPWDGKWRLVVYNIPEKLRVLRDRLRSKLHSLGFANLSTSVWISPYDFFSEIEAFTSGKKMSRYVETFEAEYKGKRKVKELVVILWELDELARRYQSFISRYATLYSRHKRAVKAGGSLDLAECFGQRFCLSAEYIALRLEDPMLPLELLPKTWSGFQAQGLYKKMYNLLKTPADEFVDMVLRR
jgi:phenylacetic acid degradation operon negative regulatory protein